MKNQLEKLRAKLAQLQGRMTTMLNENPDGFDDTQSAEYDQLESDFDATRADIEKVEARIEKQAQREAFLGAPQKPAYGREVIPSENYQDGGNEGGENEASYRSAFWAVQARHTLTPDQSRALSVGVADKGGYLVPEEFQTTIIEKLKEKSYMRNLATVSVSSSTENIPVEGADVACAWLDEGEAYPVGDVGIGRVVMKAWKMGVTIKATRELLQDSFTSIEAYIAMKFAKSVIKTEESAFVSGDGTKGAKGFLLDATLGVTTAANDAITADEIIDLWGSLDEDYAGESTWMMNRNTLVKLMKLKDGK